MGQSITRAMLAILVLVALAVGLFALDAASGRTAGTALAFGAAVVYALLAVWTDRHPGVRRYPWLALAAIMMLVGVARLASG